LPESLAKKLKVLKDGRIIVSPAGGEKQWVLSCGNTRRAIEIALEACRVRCKACGIKHVIVRAEFQEPAAGGARRMKKEVPE